MELLSIIKEKGRNNNNYFGNKYVNRYVYCFSCQIGKFLDNIPVDCFCCQVGKSIKIEENNELFKITERKEKYDIHRLYYWKIKLPGIHWCCTTQLILYNLQIP